MEGKLGTTSTISGVLSPDSVDVFRGIEEDPSAALMSSSSSSSSCEILPSVRALPMSFSSSRRSVTSASGLDDGESEGMEEPGSLTPKMNRVGQ